MSTLTYKCPSCGAPLEFDGRQQEMSCDSCGNTFDPQSIIAVNQIHKEDAGHEDIMHWDMIEDSFTPGDLQQTKAYSCSSCGAELFTEETTVATACAFCGSPSVIPAQFTDETRPRQIIPFIIDKIKAEQMFRDYFKNKKLIPNLFLKGPNQIDEIRKLYVPFWIFDCDADARMSYRGTTVSSHRSGQYMVRTTRHYLIHRAGSLSFQGLPVDASIRLDNKITESIEPFNQGEAIEYAPHTLSGAQANRADVDTLTCQSRANERVKRTTDQVFRSTVSGYSSVVPESSSIKIINGTSRPVLYPVWLITTKKGGKTYTFAINGQTGALTCDIPWSKTKFLGRLASMACGATAAGFAIIYALSAMGVLK
jgi:DNA-directed RNA polymerase subunit RPC12/RpoP